LIEGVEVEVDAEEVAEDDGVGQKNYEEPGPCRSVANFLHGEEMERDPSGREEVEAAAMKINDSNKFICRLFLYSGYLAVIGSFSAIISAFQQLIRLFSSYFNYLASFLAVNKLFSSYFSYFSGKFTYLAIIFAI